MAGSSRIKAGQAYVELGLENKMPGDLTLAERNLKARVEGIQKTLKLLRKEDRETGEAALGSVLKGGAGGITDAVASYFGAGVAVMGIDFFARGLKTAAEEAAKLKQELAEGKITIGEMGDRLMGTVPVFGQVWQAGRAIHDLLSGEKEAIEAINRETKLSLALQASQLRAAQTLLEVQRQQAAESRKTQAAIKDVGASPYSRQRNAILQERQERLANASKDREEILKKIRGPAQEALKDQRAVVANADAALAPDPWGVVSPMKDWTRQQVDEALASGKYWGAEETFLKDRRAKFEAQREAGLKLKQMQDKLNSDLAGANKKFDKEQGNKGKLETLRLQELDAKQSAEELGKFSADAIKSASQMESKARSDALRLQGKNLEADIIDIDEWVKDKRKAIDDAAAAEKGKLGVTGPADPRAIAINMDAQRQRKAVDAEADMRRKMAETEEARRKVAEAHELAGITNQGIVDPLARRKAELKEQYDYEVKMAADSAEKKLAAEQRYQAALKNLEAEHTREQERANRDIGFDIAGQRIVNSTRGIYQRMAMLELERQRALEEDADPSKATHVGAEKINELYDLRKEGMMNQGIISRGTFSAAAAAQMGVGGGMVIDEAMRKTAENTARTAKATEEISGAVKEGDWLRFS